jgi:hypothetical protein
VPLSEHEQRVLQELEQTLYADDPAFANRVKSETVYKHAGRYCVWSALAFIGGLVMLMIWLSSFLPLSFAGFVIMLGAAAIFERNARRMGRAGWHEISSAMRVKGTSEALGDAVRRLKERFGQH